MKGLSKVGRPGISKGLLGAMNNERRLIERTGILRQVPTLNKGRCLRFS